MVDPEKPSTPVSGREYRWLKEPVEETVESRIRTPRGYERTPLKPGSFGAWLRNLPLRPGRPPVTLYNGRKKFNQSAHFAVLLIDVGDKDLQQCADAVMRLRAEYLLSRGCESSIAFHFTSGDLAKWSDWRSGIRPRVQGNNVSWSRTGDPDGSYRNFRKYLDIVFSYAGSASLSRELETVADPLLVEEGDVFIQGGFPGHAVIVIDVAEDRRGERIFLLAQSYMPAQDIHILRNPGSRINPWYPAAPRGTLATPEWTFRYENLKRFPSVDCR